MSFSAPMSTHTIRGGAGKRLSFKAKALQSILDQVVHSALRPGFPSPSHDAGQPCSFIIAGEEAERRRQEAGKRMREEEEGVEVQ